MRLFVYEHVTGGGLIGQPLPQSLAHEGDRMVRALVNDLMDIDGTEVIAMRDPRFDPLGPSVVSASPLNREDFWQTFRRCVGLADAVWPIAPEEGGALEYLSRIVIDSGTRLIGSAPDAVAIAASKRWTAACLASYGVPAVEAYSGIDQLPSQCREVIVKPDDGAGCQDTYLFRDRTKAGRWLEKRPDRERFILQPYVEGEPLSISALFSQGHAIVLSCNQQHIRAEDGMLHFRGVTVNAVEDSFGNFRVVAQKVSEAIPGLWGYVGIDVVQTREGPVVIEVNPRLTTSYVGLRSALGNNPAAMVLSLAELRYGSTQAHSEKSESMTAMGERHA